MKNNKSLLLSDVRLIMSIERNKSYKLFAFNTTDLSMPIIFLFMLNVEILHRRYKLR